MTDEKKKMTAQGSSVGADDGQSILKNSKNSIPTSRQKSNDEIVNSQDSLEEMYRKIQRMTDPRYLHTLTMTELFQTTYKSRPPVVEGLLYTGAYILAGAPKIGKSFLVAQIAYHVSTGQDLWGYKVHQGTVLYLALEDDFQRIQSRMFMMYGVNDTPNLHFATAAGKIGNGLDEQLKNFVQEHPDTNLIIIDTMQKIREVGGEAYSYASDYEIIGRIKQFADQHGICVLTVHHTRKQQADDSFETISGTTGLCGWFAADAEEKAHGTGLYHQSCRAGSAGSDPLLEEGPADPDLESGTHGKRAVQRTAGPSAGCSCKVGFP